MKTITLLLALAAILTLSSCTNGVNSLTQQNFDGAEYYVVQYTSESEMKDLKQYARDWKRDDYTTFYFFFHEDSVDAKKYTDFKYSKKGYYKQILKDKPQHGLYIMPYDNKIYTDGTIIIEMAISEKYN
jgi:hypothetical protein